MGRLRGRKARDKVMAIHQLTDEDGEIKAVISLNGIVAITPTENGVCIKRYDLSLIHI